ncbi:MAG TPA: IPT/TIG domain-containing protein [Acidimicrobiales bacterium]
MALRIDRLSQHEVNAGDTSTIFVYGEGFEQVQGVAFGDEWGDVRNIDGGTVITVVPPQLPAGSECWVVVWCESGESSPCETDAQWFKVLALDEAPTGGELRIDSITPEEITIGRADGYWLTGSGFGRVSVVGLASDACQFEVRSDDRLVFWVKEQIDGVVPDAENDLLISTPDDQKTLRVTCRPVPGPAPENEGEYPVILSVLPDELSADGGFVTITGHSFLGVVQATLGDVGLLNIDVVSANEVRATVPTLYGYEGQSLEPCVITNDVASPSTSARVTVTPGS